MAPPLTDFGETPPPPAGSLAEGEPPAPLFVRPPLLTRFLDQTEEQIRSRLVKLSLFRRVFLLERDWMTRITMLMVILSVFWGAVGAFDIFGWRTQVTAWALGQPLHLSNQEVYASLTLHGIRMLFGFAQQLEMAIFGVLLINALGLVPRHKWVLYLSVFLLNLGIVFMEGPFYLLPQFNDNYFPAVGWYFYSPLGIRGLSSYVATPLWYLGWVLLCAALFLWAGWMIAHFRDWWKTHEGSRGTRRLPPFLLFILATLILIPLSYAAVFAAAIWDLANYFGTGPYSPLLNQVVFWFFGHGIVYILFLISVTSYYLLVPIFAKRPIYSYRFAFVAAVMFTVLTPVLSIHHLYLTPVSPWATWTTMAITFLIILPSAISFFTIWMTLKGVRPRDWEWNGATLFLLLSFAGSIAGGLTGPDNNTIGFDVDLHNTLFIVSHFHALVLLSITAAGFALTYALLPLLFGRLWYSPALARLHFVTTTVGWSGLVLFMDLLGTDGLLRRSLIFPRLPVIVFDQLWLTVFVVVTLVAQLFLAANILLTIFRGEVLSAAGLSLDETIRKIASSTHPRPRVPIRDVPFSRRVPRGAREGAERRWATVVAVLLGVVLVATSPFGFSVSNAISTPPDPPAGSEYLTVVGEQYFWSVSETGPIHGNFSNVIVARAGQWVAVSATAQGATEGFYIPFRTLPTVDVEVLPGSWSYAVFQAPSQPGVYGVPNSEYNGPWFGQDVGALIVLPANGSPSASLSAFQSDGGQGNIYDPPIVTADGAQLVGDDEGLFDHSVPGPTLSATAGPISFTWTVPLSTIGVDNYLVNVTTNNPDGQRQWLAAHNDTLPYDFGIYAIGPTGSITPVTRAPLHVGSVNPVNLTLPAGVYLYGLAQPIPYVYDPDGESNWMTGSQAGDVMGLWGVLWVAP
jgi:cytochrome c oxidase subunit I